MDVTTELGYDQYEIRRPLLDLLGGAYRVVDPAGQVLFYADRQSFRLRDKICLYTDKRRQTEALVIEQRRLPDWAGAYEVREAETEHKIGGLKFRWLRSLVRDEWVVTDAEEQDLGVIREESILLCLVRRFGHGFFSIANLLPHTYELLIDDSPVATFKQNFNPFAPKLTVDFSSDPGHRLDRRLGLAVGVLLCTAV